MPLSVHIDEDVNAGGASDASEGDVGHAKKQSHAEEDHEEGLLIEPLKVVGEETDLVDNH